MEPLHSSDSERVGRYTLLARLGAGGMGEVFLARAGDGRKVAVKVLASRHAGEDEFRRRFAREVAAARQVGGAFTAAVLDAGPEAPLPWLATVFVPGLTLQEAVTACGPLPEDAVRALAIGLAEALASIHSVGVVHRDLKPSNVMLAEGGPKVIDFGIARPEEVMGITQDGQAIGTPAYMSPEQAAGLPSEPSTDLFSLGVVLRYAATGEPGFHSGHAVPEAAPLRLRDRRLAECVADCLEADEARRPTAEALLDRLGHGPASLQGADWLPEDVAIAIARRAAEAIPGADPGPRPPAPESDLATLEPPGALAGRPGGTERRRLLAVGLGAAGALAAGGAAWALLRDTGTEAPPVDASPVASPTPSPSPSPPPPALTAKWTAEVHGYEPELCSTGEQVFAESDQILHAFDPQTGEVQWEREVLRASTIGDRLYIAHDEFFPETWTTLAEADPESGEPVWNHRYDGKGMLWRGPVPAGPLLCYGPDEVLAIRADDGSHAWTANLSAASGLAADANLVLAADERLVALDAATGDERWTYEGFRGSPQGPSVGNGVVLVWDLLSRLIALNPEDGTELWSRSVSGALSVEHGDGVLFAAGAEGRVHALRADTGEELWTAQTEVGDEAWFATLNLIHLADAALYVCGGAVLWAFDTADGSIAWTYTAQAPIIGPAVTCEGLVCVGTDDGLVHAVDPSGAP